MGRRRSSGRPRRSASTRLVLALLGVVPPAGARGGAGVVAPMAALRLRSVFDHRDHRRSPHARPIPPLSPSLAATPLRRWDPRDGGLGRGAQRQRCTVVRIEPKCTVDRDRSAGDARGDPRRSAPPPAITPSMSRATASADQPQTVARPGRRAASAAIAESAKGWPASGDNAPVTERWRDRCRQPPRDGGGTRGDRARLPKGCGECDGLRRQKRRRSGCETTAEPLPPTAPQRWRDRGDHSRVPRDGGER